MVIYLKAINWASPPFKNENLFAVYLLFQLMSSVGLWSVIVVFPGHIHECVWGGGRHRRAMAVVVAFTGHVYMVFYRRLLCVPLIVPLLYLLNSCLLSVFFFGCVL